MQKAFLKTKGSGLKMPLVSPNSSLSNVSNDEVISLNNKS